MRDGIFFEKEKTSAAIPSRTNGIESSWPMFSTMFSSKPTCGSLMNSMRNLMPKQPTRKKPK